MAKNTSISLGPHFENFIQSQISTGRYKSVSDVVRASLRLLENDENKNNMVTLEELIKESENSKMIRNYDSKKHLEEIHNQYL